MPRDPQRKGGRPPRRPPRQAPPPEHTGDEQRYLDECRADGRTVTVSLVDGSSHSGTIAGYTADVLSLEQASGVLELRTAMIRFVADG